MIGPCWLEVRKNQINLCQATDARKNGTFGIFTDIPSINRNTKSIENVKTLTHPTTTRVCSLRLLNLLARWYMSIISILLP
jgi:hypothetical protein